MAFSNITRSKQDPRILKSGPSSLSATDRLGRGLGWLGVGLGLAQLIAPHRLTRALGVEGRERLVRGFGARDIASGVLTLSTEKQLGLWSRVAGDAMNVAALMPAVDQHNPKRRNAKLALALALGVTALDVFAARGVTFQQRRRPQSVRSYRDRSGFPTSVGARSRAPSGYRPHMGPTRVQPPATNTAAEDSWWPATPG